MNKKKSANGVYAVQLWALNVPITIVVDDYIALYEEDNYSGPAFAQAGADGSLWGPIIEKAFAKFHGNYARLDPGDPTDGVSSLNGSPF